MKKTSTESFQASAGLRKMPIPGATVLLFLGFYLEESGRFLWVKRGESARCRNGDLSYLYKRIQPVRGY
jgi:hypothetical protein